MFNFGKSSVDDKQLEKTIENFFDDNRLEKEELRLYVAHELEQIKLEISNILYQKNNESFWVQMQNQSAMNEKSELLRAVEAIRKIPVEVDFWQRESVESQERFEFFIISKAAELNSGDQNRDYYHAMLIRHDQLIAVTYVFRQSIKHLQNCLTIPVNEVIYSDDFKYFYERTTAERIYKMAEMIYKTRKRLGKL